MVRFMVRRFLLGSDIERSELESRLRLVLHSFLEDGAYARELYETISDRVIPLFAASLAAAAGAGDIPARRVSAANRFWFAQHVAAMLAFATLPGQSCMPYEGSLDELVEEASTFILRGFGMSDAAIASVVPQKLPSAAD